MGNRVSQNEHFVELTGRGNGLRSFYEVPLYMYCALRLMYLYYQPFVHIVRCIGLYNQLSSVIIIYLTFHTSSSFLKHVHSWCFRNLVGSPKAHLVPLNPSLISTTPLHINASLFRHLIIENLVPSVRFSELEITKEFLRFLFNFWLLFT